MSSKFITDFATLLEDPSARDHCLRFSCYVALAFKWLAERDGDGRSIEMWQEAFTGFAWARLALKGGKFILLWPKVTQAYRKWRKEGTVLNLLRFLQLAALYVFFVAGDFLWFHLLKLAPMSNRNFLLFRDVVNFSIGLHDGLGGIRDLIMLSGDRLGALQTQSLQRSAFKNALNVLVQMHWLAWLDIGIGHGVFGATTSAVELWERWPNPKVGRLN